MPGNRRFGATAIQRAVILGLDPRMTAGGIAIAANPRNPANPNQFYPPRIHLPYPDDALSLEACVRTGKQGKGRRLSCGKRFPHGVCP